VKTLRRRIAVAATTVAIIGSGFVVGTTSAASAGGVRCTPGYRPCIPLRRSDVDCYGGSGNGPRYTRPGVVYRVFGSDRYGLDADNDGRGCE
jgi:resuscitation-promoting factor RpfB